MRLESAVGLAASALPAFIWVYLLLGRGRFWQVGRHLPPPAVQVLTAPKVAVVIPARNEAEVIRGTVTSLLAQSFHGDLSVFLVDDGSTDGTVEAARSAAHQAGRSHLLHVVGAGPLCQGWTGKMWAVAQGVDAALLKNPDYLLLTDADIEHEPDSISTLISICESGNYDLVSLTVKLQCRTFAERALIPAFVFFFFLLYPPAWIADTGRRTAGAAGGCMLIRPSRLQQAGGIAAIRGEIIDDCALARVVKRAGGRVWLGLAERIRSTRPYGGFAEIGKMISRTAFNQLRHSSLLLAGTLAGLAVSYVLPVVLTLSTRTPYSLLGAAAWLLMIAAYTPMVRFYRLNPLWALVLPVIAVFYSAATIHSAVRFWRGRGGEWKGRLQDAKRAG
jgi:hopene-associated glycosyltransferase HpnB